MPPRLDEYHFRDWLHLRPVIHRLKTRRYRAIDQDYCARAPRTDDCRSLIADLRGRKALISIAFGDAQLIEWQALLVRRYVPDAYYVVADNTGDDVRAARIAAVARARGVP
ncbi:MAG: hypothetical protein HY056_17225, partial [Proteobacteria bacterium]|nr:hypothetical protein [Pseudomonadota bacterium]